MRGSAMHSLGLILLTGSALILGACSSTTQVANHGSDAPMPPVAVNATAPTHKTRVDGPPPHANAYGHRTKHRFNYYPSSRAYHNCETGSWFWFESSGWESGVKLPRHVVIRASEAISVALDARAPYDDPNSPAARTHITHGSNSKIHEY